MRIRKVMKKKQVEKDELKDLLLGLFQMLRVRLVQDICDIDRNMGQIERRLGDKRK